MTSDQQRQSGISAGRSAANLAIRLGYMAWLKRQIKLCRQTADHMPYAAGYVVGAMEVLNSAAEHANSNVTGERA